jgi:protein-S-isoprenylcysteine O-methyltransferase Ste14
MIGEFNLYGIYVPWLLLLGLVSIVCTRLIGYVLVRIGFYRFVWHPALFDFALFIIVLGAWTFLLPAQVF